VRLGCAGRGARQAGPRGGGQPREKKGEQLRTSTFWASNKIGHNEKGERKRKKGFLILKSNKQMNSIAI
jgi:hypothetical protein